MPGGGAAAAMTVALGISLGEMVCRLNIKRMAEKDVEKQLKKIDQLIKMRIEVLSLIDEDAKAFQELMAQFKKGKKSEQLGAYFEKCTKAPLRMCELAGEAVEIIETQRKLTNRFLLSDLDESELLLSTGWKAARLNVEINLNGMKDAKRVQAIRDMVKATW